MVSKERLNQYQIWFRNLSFFNNNSYVLDNINDLWNLINYIGYRYHRIVKRTSCEGLHYSGMSSEETFWYAQTFFDNHNVDLNIQTLLEEEILNILDSSRKHDDYYNTEQDGCSYYDDNGKKVVDSVFIGKSLDCAILIHELMHYYNQPSEKRNIINDLLTESISYGAELMFYEDNKEKFQEDRYLHYAGVMRTLYGLVDKIYYIYKIIYLFHETKTINKRAYNKLFKDNGYEITLKCFEEYASLKKSILKDTWTILDLVLAIYFLEEYRVNPEFSKNILEFNDSLNRLTFYECLSIIGMNNKEEIISKIKSSSDSFINYFEKIEKEINGTKSVGHKVK